MSLYSFAAANLTTPDDRKRRPAVNFGQITRTLILLTLMLATLTLAKQLSHAAAAGEPVVIAQTSR